MNNSETTTKARSVLAVGVGLLIGASGSAHAAETLRIEGDAWKTKIEEQRGLAISDEHVSPSENEAFARTTILRTKGKRKAVAPEPPPPSRDLDSLPEPGRARVGLRTTVFKVTLL